MTTDKRTAYPDLTKSQRAVLVAATQLYAKHLKKLGEDAGELGKEKDAASYRAEGEAIAEDLVAKLEQDTPQLFPHERRAVERGLVFFLKNLRAAKGTVRGLGKSDLADTFEEEAVEIERDLVPQFADQIELKV
jgi:hypothetical protein